MTPRAFGAPAANERTTVVRGSKGQPEGGDTHRLVWRYPRFSTWDYAASAAVTAVALYLQFGIEGDFPDGSWDNGILFDDSVRSALVAETRTGRNRAALFSDLFWYGPQYYPILIDGLFVPLATDQLNFDVAWQLSMINWQAESLAAMLTRLSHRTVGRARPSLKECARDPNYSVDCAPDAEERTASFVSGHTSMAMTGAALVCAHHQALPLYGSDFADAAICAVMLAAASTNGVMRLVADQHWPSDVLASITIGLSTGYALPYLLHYRNGRPEPLGSSFLPRRTVVLPMVSERVLGLRWMGLF